MERGRKEEVELVEVGAGEPLDDETWPDPADEVRETRASWRRVARAWPVVVVALVAVVAYGVSAQRSSARTEALRASVLYVQDLSAELRELWSVDGVGAGYEHRLPVAQQLEGRRALVAGDLLLVPGAGSWGEVVAIDVVTGEERWRLEDSEEPRVCGSSTGRDGVESVVCERTRWDTSVHGVTSIDTVERVLELRDRATGELLDAVRGPADEVVPWGDEVVRVESDDDGVWLSLESYSGEVRWRTRYAESLADGEAPWLSAQGPDLVVNGARALLLDGDGNVVLDLDEVRPGPSEAPTPGILVPLTGDRFLFAVFDPEARGVEPRSFVLDRDGTVLLDALGMALGPWVEDGTLPDVHVVWREDGVELWETGADEPLLRHTGDAPQQTLLLDGVALFADSTGLQAVDVADGAQLWSRPGEDGRIIGADGEALLLHRGTTLEARSVRTGEQLWHVSIGSAHATPVVHGGMVFVHSDERLVRYGP